MERENPIAETNEEDHESEDSLLLRMREGRKSYPTVFMKFVQYKDLHATHAFCFYEGEDGMYYDRRIEEYLCDGDRFITLIAGNKKNVLKAMKKICSDASYYSVRKMFFVDHDYDAPQSPHKDLYETPGYSVENFYVDEDAFHRVLRSAFYINKHDPDFVPCINVYRETFRQFHEIILPFNARVKYKHQYAPDNTDCCFSGVNNLHLSRVTIGCAIKANRHNEAIRKLDDALNPDAQVLAKIERDLRKEPNPYYTYRGKNELYCFIQLLEQMRDTYNNSKETENGSFFKERQKKVKLDPSNNPLGTLSQFASTPQDLINFIIDHRPRSS